MLNRITGFPIYIGKLQKIQAEFMSRRPDSYRMRPFGLLPDKNRDDAIAVKNRTMNGASQQTMIVVIQPGYK